MPSPRFYVYILCRPNGKPFYVGKGSGNRVYDHEREAKRGHQCHKCSVIRKIWRSGSEVVRYTVFETDDEQAAFDHERELIALYGRDSLANKSDGGEGPTGMNGELSPVARFTWVQVRDMRARYSAGGITADVLAAEYETHQTCVSKIVRNETWYDPEYTPPDDRKKLNRASFRGDRNGLARLTWEDIRAIRARYMAGGVTCKQIASDYAIACSGIVKIIANLTWADSTYTPPPAARRYEGQRTFNAEQAVQARALYATGEWTYKQLAQHFECSVTALWNAINGRKK